MATRTAQTDPAGFDELYRRTAASMGYDHPVFYFTISNAALPDTLSRITRPGERYLVRTLTLDTGNWPAVQRFYRSVREIAFGSGVATSDEGVDRVQTARQLLQLRDADRVRTYVGQLRRLGGAERVVAAYENLVASPRKTRLLLPAFRWHGWDNQYHRWLTGFLRGDLGTATNDQQPVSNKVAAALPWTVLLNALALLVVFVVSIPVGLYLAEYAGTRRDRWMSLGLFLLFGIPSFWTATLVSTFLTTPAYGIDLFPSMGVGILSDDADWLEVLGVRGAHLFLPVMCLAYPSFAYVSRHLRNAALDELGKGYARLARMKGLSRRSVIWRHVLRNASFPLITLSAGILPALLTGSVLIERIFNLPGMGDLLIDSVLDNDWPTVIALVMINGVLTAIGLLLADLAYQLVDPRIRLSRAAVGQPLLP